MLGPLAQYWIILHFVFAAAGLAGKHDCSLDVIHWCATDFGGLAAGALTCMVSCISCMHVGLILVGDIRGVCH